MNKKVKHSLLGLGFSAMLWAVSLCLCYIGDFENPSKNDAIVMILYDAFYLIYGIAFAVYCGKRKNFCLYCCAMLVQIIPISFHIMTVAMSILGYVLSHMDSLPSFAESIFDFLYELCYPVYMSVAGTVASTTKIEAVWSSIAYGISAISPMLSGYAYYLSAPEKKATESYN